MNNNDTFDQQWSQLKQRYQQTRCPKSPEELERSIQAAMNDGAKPSRHPWRYAAAAAAVLAVAGVAIAILSRPEPQHYAYSETKSGVRIYCESGCNADEVLQQINETILTLN